MNLYTCYIIIDPRTSFRSYNLNSIYKYAFLITETRNTARAPKGTNRKAFRAPSAPYRLRGVTQTHHIPEISLRDLNDAHSRDAVYIYRYT